MYIAATIIIRPETEVRGSLRLIMPEPARRAPGEGVINRKLPMTEVEGRILALYTV